MPAPPRQDGAGVVGAAGVPDQAAGAALELNVQSI
jgi:hypothetical protein